MINWKLLYSKIPAKFKIGRKIVNVQWVKDFPDKNQVGESDWNNKLISLKTKQSKKEAVHTYFHELLHIISDEYDIKLTEKQVQELEKTLSFWIESGKIFK